MISLSFIESINNYMNTDLTLYWITLIIGQAIFLTLAKSKEFGRRFPINYILLISWTFCQGYFVSNICAYYNSPLVIMAWLMTLAITCSLTLYACTTKTDFTFLGGFLYCAVTILLFWLCSISYSDSIQILCIVYLDYWFSRLT